MDEKKIILRDANMGDLESTVELYKQLYTVEYHVENKICANLMEPGEYFASKGFKKETIYKKKCIKDPKIKFIVAVYEEKVIGYTNGFIKNYPAFLSKVLYGEEIVVNEEYQKHGVGDLLIQELIKWGKKKKAKQMVFNAFRDNKAAMSKYVNLGFKERHICLYKQI